MEKGLRNPKGTPQVVPGNQSVCAGYDLAKSFARKQSQGSTSGPSKSLKESECESHGGNTGQDTAPGYVDLIL